MTEKTKKERLEQSLNTIDMLVENMRDPLTLDQQIGIDNMIQFLKDGLSEPEPETNKTMH